MATIEETFIRLKKSQFRAKFHLTDKDKKYINEKGMDEIRKPDGNGGYMYYQNYVGSQKKMV